MTFDAIPSDQDEEIFTLTNDQKLTTAHLNPILLAIKAKSFATLKYLVERFGVRQSLKEEKLTVRVAHGDYEFTNVMLPLLIKTKDTDALTYLLK